MDLNNPMPKEWGEYVTQSPVGLEIIPDMLYDTETYTDNVTVRLVFFVDTEANESLSNVRNGVLPNPQSFLAQAVRILYRTTVQTDDAGAAGAFASQMNDIVLLTNTGILSLKIGEKIYGPWPLWMIPSGSFVQGALSAAGGEAANLVHDYAQVKGSIWELVPNLMLAPLQNFEARITWPAAVNLTGDVDVQLVLEGQRARAIQ
jgi:hypothetical protein